MCPSFDLGAIDLTLISDGHADIEGDRRLYPPVGRLDHDGDNYRFFPLTEKQSPYICKKPTKGVSE